MTKIYLKRLLKKKVLYQIAFKGESPYFGALHDDKFWNMTLLFALSELENYRRERGFPKNYYVLYCKKHYARYQELPKFLTIDPCEVDVFNDILEQSVVLAITFYTGEVKTTLFDPFQWD